MSCYEFYFSPTGGTRKVADAIVEGWGEAFTPVDMMKPAQQKCFKAGDLCLVAVPSYGGRVPAPAVDWVRELCGSGARAVLVVAFGNRAIDDTLLELSDELTKAGFSCVAGVEAVAEHSLLHQFGAGRPDAQDVQELNGYGQKIRAAVEGGTLSGKLELPGNRPYRAYGGVPMKPKASSGCINCGLCAAECPVGAIPMTNFRMTDTQKCISCMHCVAICPKHVRKVSKLVQFVAGHKMKQSCSGRKENKLYL